MDGDLAGCTLLGKLRVIRALGAGGMATVYEVEHLMTGHRRALKVLHPALAEDAQATARLLREASIAGKVASPRVVETLDVGQLEDGRAYVLMELLVGRSLKERVRESGALPASEVARIGVQIGEGLAAAHAAGVIHRDLTPANVFLVGPRGAEEVKLVDFGLSKMLPGHTDRFGALTATGTLLGTPSYMAPEQVIVGATVGPHTDQYAMAVVLYECLTGDKAIGASGLAEAIAQISAGHHVPLHTRLPHLDARLAAAIERAMSVDPGARFPSVDGLTDALRTLAGRATAAPPGTQPVGVPNTTPAPVHPAPPTASVGAGPAPTMPGPAPPHVGPAAYAMTHPTPSAVLPPRRASPARIVGIGLVVVAAGVLVLGGALLATRALLVHDEGSAQVGPATPSPPEQPGGGAPPEATPFDDMRYVPELQALMAAQDWRGCLALSGRVDQTVHVLESRISCAANAGEWDVYRESCHALHDLDPANLSATYCMQALAESPPPE